MKFTALIVNGAIKRLLRILCRIEDSQLERVPRSGPLILVVNHINFLEVPLIYTHLLPRSVTGFIKAETWDDPAMAFLFNLWEGIPIRRGEVDRTAFRRGLTVLERGDILTVAPEGTRSGTGLLARGHPGIVLLALQSGAPLLPVVYYGGEKFRQNISRLRRTDFHTAVGNLFYLETGGIKLTQAVRQQITDEIMYQLASLLPPNYRGYYADAEKATRTYLRFPTNLNNTTEATLPRIASVNHLGPA